MPKPRYKIVRILNDTFQLYEDGVQIASFTYMTFRDELQALGRSSNWIGSILRLLHRRYPPSKTYKQRNDLERLVDQIGESGLADYLRSKGIRVFKSLSVPDKALIAYLEAKGYVIEGLLEGSYYSTDESYLKKPVLEESSL